MTKENRLPRAAKTAHAGFPHDLMQRHINPEIRSIGVLEQSFSHPTSFSAGTLRRCLVQMFRNISQSARCVDGELAIEWIVKPKWRSKVQLALIDYPKTAVHRSEFVNVFHILGQRMVMDVLFKFG